MLDLAQVQEGESANRRHGFRAARHDSAGGQSWGNIGNQAKANACLAGGARVCPGDKSSQRVTVILLRVARSGTLSEGFAAYAGADHSTVSLLRPTGRGRSSSCRPAGRVGRAFLGTLPAGQAGFLSDLWLRAANRESFVFCPGRRGWPAQHSGNRDGDVSVRVRQSFRCSCLSIGSWRLMPGDYDAHECDAWLLSRRVSLHPVPAPPERKMASPLCAGRP